MQKRAQSFTSEGPAGPERRSSGRVRNVIASALLLVALIGGAGATIGASPAGAAGATQCASRGCDMFKWGPNNGYFFSTPGGARVGMICWTDSVYYAGSVRWFYVSTIYGDGRAWVPANQVVNQTAVRHC